MAASFALDNAGLIMSRQLAASTSGLISFTDNDGLTVTTVGATSGITTDDDNVTINSTGGLITVSQPITTAGGAATGTVLITGGVTIGATLTTAGGNITLNGNTAVTADVDINANITSPGTITVTAPRDILVGAKLETTGGAGMNIMLTADSDSDGTGGVQIESGRATRFR